MPDLADAVSQLRSEWGLDFARVRRVLAKLAAGATVTELVSASGLPRRDVESVVRALTPFLVPDGERQVLPASTLTERERPIESVLAAQMAALADGLPPSRWRLDHVPATAETMARRALYLAKEYELDGASVLCLGDHDLTALAVGSVEAGAELTVVDIDEQILDHIAASGDTLKRAVTTAWADLRLGLPPSHFLDEQNPTWSRLQVDMHLAGAEAADEGVAT